MGSVKGPFRLSDTLVLRKIPKELNTITKLSGHFEKFGTIVNLQVSKTITNYMYTHYRNTCTCTHIVKHVHVAYCSYPDSQVRYENDPESAIVQFTNPHEAKKAHDSVEAVLNNRFIKVYYLKNNGQQPFSFGQKENFLKTSVREAHAQ